MQLTCDYAAFRKVLEFVMLARQQPSDSVMGYVHLSANPTENSLTLMAADGEMQVVRAIDAVVDTSYMLAFKPERLLRICQCTDADTVKIEVDEETVTFEIKAINAKIRLTELKYPVYDIFSEFCMPEAGSYIVWSPSDFSRAVKCVCSGTKNDCYLCSQVCMRSEANTLESSSKQFYAAKYAAAGPAFGDSVLVSPRALQAAAQAATPFSVTLIERSGSYDIAFRALDAAWAIVSHVATAETFPSVGDIVLQGFNHTSGVTIADLFAVMSRVIAYSGEEGCLIKLSGNPAENVLTVTAITNNTEFCEELPASPVAVTTDEDIYEAQDIFNALRGFDAPELVDTTAILSHARIDGQRALMITSMLGFKALITAWSGERFKGSNDADNM